LDNTYYSIGGEYYLKILAGENVEIRTVDGQEELIVPISGKTTLQYSILW
jgi:hypothetical protein